MLSHAPRFTTSHNSPFFAVLQSAAGRAWTKTSPGRVVRYSTVPVQLKDVEKLGEGSRSLSVETSKDPL